jgi:hypothetical protein
MAARACLDRRLRRYFGNRIVWLEAGEKPDPVELLAALAHRLRMTSAAITSASVERARELLQPVLAGKRLLIVVDNVSERAVIDAFRDLAPSCTVMVTSRVPELAALAKAAQIQVDRLTPEQSLELLGLWTGHDVATLPPEAELLCAKSWLWRWSAGWPAPGRFGVRWSWWSAFLTELSPGRVRRRDPNRCRT